MSIDLSNFTTGQVTFIRQLAANTGLDAGVVAAWVIQEENGSAAQARQSAGNNDWLNVGYTDIATLGAGNNVWANPTSAANATANWMKGTWNDPGYGIASAVIQSIPKTAGQSPAAQIAAIQSTGKPGRWATSAYPDFQTIYAELSPQLKRTLGAGVAKGGVAGAGGSGTVPNGSSTTTYAFSISGVSNPDEDYWTGINRLAQEVNWYLFTSGEYLYFLDGEEMLRQTPAAYLDRVKDAGRFYQNQGSLSYDNSSYQFTANRKRRFHPQRKTHVTMPTSPTEGTFQVICGIDEILGGDVVELSGFGLGDGRWIVGEARRSVFDTYTEVTLVPPTTPLSEASAVGTTGTSASKSSSSIVYAPGNKPTSASGYVNPLSRIQNLTPERIDMGVDYSGSGPLLAIGDGRIVSTMNSGWPKPSAFIELELLSGAYAGKFWYYAENITPTVQQGEKVAAGDPIGILHDAYPNLETGWSVGNGGDTLAARTGQANLSSGHSNCAAGFSANRFLKSLGAPGGVPTGPPVGTMPSGYP